jgi:hypothetical protein
VRLELNTSGKGVTSATVIDAAVPDTAEPTFLALWGDSLSYLTVSNTPRPEFIVRRIPLH